MSKIKKIKDPHASREAENYENPIPSREYIIAHLEKIAEPVSYPLLAEQLELHSYDESEALRRRLIAMKRDGQLISNRKGVYGLPDRMELIKGRVQGTREGYGFFIPADGSGDLFLGPREMQKVFDGDTVLARHSGFDRRGRREGMIVEVLQRRSKQIVGRYYWEQGFGVVVADNSRISHEILIPEKDNHGAKDGQFVVAEITSYPTSRRKTTAKIVEILGDHMTPGMEINVAIRSHEIPFEWPKAVLKQARKFSDRVTEEETRGRIDLRQLPFVTIDGEDAKDFDDAVYCQPGVRGTCKLFVAIADVSHYVGIDTPLDTEAINRGNSVYFPGHVIPMLPESLSNGLCSLKPKVDRLTMVCEMEINARGEMTDYTFYEGVICSHARLTYTEVSDMLEAPANATKIKLQKKLQEKYSELIPHLDALYDLYKKLSAQREANGSMDFANTETRIVFGETKKIREIVPVHRNDAHRLIEECMLSANVATAKFLESSALSILYRVHEGPNEDKLENLREFLRGMGLSLGGKGKPEPRDYQLVLKEVADRPDAHLIQTVLIRSLMQAVYQPENRGHFGLGYEAYTHFTSPIRRYPDLLVHRALCYLIRSRNQKEHVRKAPGAIVLTKKSIYPYGQSEIESAGTNCSMTERRADSATWEVIDWLKCEYIQDRVGDEFSGTISSVTGFGLFVELSDIYVEGLVHITDLKNDYYKFDPARHSLKGERSGSSYNLGDTVRVKVIRVDLDERKIDLHLIDEGKSNLKRKPAKKNNKKSNKGASKKDSVATKSEKTNKGKKTKSKVKKEVGKKKGSAEKKTVKAGKVVKNKTVTKSKEAAAPKNRKPAK